MYKSLLMMVLFSASAFCYDLGKHGHTYHIIEKDFIEHIQDQIGQYSDYEFEALLKNVTQKKIETLKNPDPVKGIRESTIYSSREYDPSITASQDVMDAQGKIIVRKGTRINPLELLPLSGEILFFDGSNGKHVDWAKEYSNAFWVLVKGSPFELEKQENRPIYYDQSGFLAKKFSIKAIPTKISQQGSVLNIEEIPVMGGI